MTTHTAQSGFAMLFTVLIVSLILSIAVSISNLTLKQAVLSGLAKDSQIAFYQADAAVECGIYRDVKLIDPATSLGIFSLDKTVLEVPQTFYCGNQLMVFDEQASIAVSDKNYFVYTFENQDQREPCYKIIFDKTFIQNPSYALIQGYGYNICQDHPRRVERALEFKY